MKITKKDLIKLIKESKSTPKTSVNEMARLTSRRKDYNPEGEQEAANFRRLWVDITTGDIYVGDAREIEPYGPDNQPLDKNRYKFIGLRVFDRIDAFFVLEREEITSWLRRHNLDVQRIITGESIKIQKALGPENVLWFHAKKFPGTLPRIQRDYNKKPFPLNYLPGTTERRPEGDPEVDRLGRPLFPDTSRKKGTTIDPKTGQESFGYIPLTDPLSGKEYKGRIWDEEERMKRVASLRDGFIPLLTKMFNDPFMQSHLAKVSLPQIKTQYYDREYLNRHAEFSNEGLKFETTTFEVYPSLNDFYKSVVMRLKMASKPEGQVVSQRDDLDSNNLMSPNQIERIETHMARYFNTVSKNWEAEERLHEPEKHGGYTEIYGLPSKGFIESKKDVGVQGLLTITGTRTDEGQFTWMASYISKVGVKLAEDNRVNSYNLNNDFVETEVVPYPQVELGSRVTLLDDEEVMRGLTNVLSRLRDRILSINGASLLRIAMPGKSSIEKMSGQSGNPQLNESFLNYTILKVLKEIKK